MLPNLIIIGGMKCGTTSLHYYLDLHPQISMSKQKEVNFFLLRRNWSKGVKWYESNFTGHTPIRGETSPAYTNYPHFGGVPERMHSVVPEAKLIYIVRDPVERIISHYVHNFSNGLTDKSIAEALENLERVTFVRQSKYYMQLGRYLEYYPMENILVVASEDLRARRTETLRDVFRFLGVDDTFQSRGFNKRTNESNRKRRKSDLWRRMVERPEINLTRRLPARAQKLAEKSIHWLFSSRVERPLIDEGLRNRLTEHLEDDIRCFRNITGRDFPDWSV